MNGKQPSWMRGAGGIIRPQMVGEAHLHVRKDLNGNFLLTINDQTAKMAPQQTHDFACRLLEALGFRIEKVDDSDGLGGPRLA